MIVRSLLLALVMVTQISTLAGYTWSSTNIIAQWRAVACDSTCTNIFAGPYDSGANIKNISKSADGGKTWYNATSKAARYTGMTYKERDS